MVPREVMLKGLNLIHSPGMLTVAEAEFLYDTAASLAHPSDDSTLFWTELGVWCGRSLWAAGCGLPSRSLLRGIDLFSGELPRREGSEEIVHFAPGILQESLACGVMRAIHDSQSKCGAHVWTAIECGYSDLCAREKSYEHLDVLVVDAAHDYDSVRRDIDAWLPKMKPGGQLIGHDYGGAFAGVTRAFDERFGDKVQRVPGTRFCRVQL